MLRNNFPHLCCWKAAKSLNIYCRKWNQTLPTFWNRYKKNVSILIISFIIIISIIFMMIIISSIAQINSWPLAQNMCGTRIWCGSCIHRNMCDFVLTCLGDLFSPLSNNNHPTKKTKQKTQILNKKFLGNEFCLLFSVLLFCPSHHLMHAAADVFWLACLFFFSHSSLFIEREKKKSLVCICKHHQKLPSWSLTTLATIVSWQLQHLSVE